MNFERARLPIASERSAALSGADAWVLLVTIAGLGTIAVLLGVDGNGDLRNYHFYNGWALLHKPLGYDIAPAQVQSYLHPLIDLVYLITVRLLNNDPRLFTFVWSIPQAIAVWFAYLIARRCLGFLPRHRAAMALLAGLIGAGGATSIGVIGTSMSEGILNSMLLGGVWLVLIGDERGRAGRGVAGHYAVAGLLAGAASVMKLVEIPYLIGFCAAITASFLLEARAWRIRGAVVFAASAGFAALVIGGPWWWAVYRAFGNPLFPFYNAVFHSPYYPAENFFDRRFLPQTTREWLLYPLEWTLRKSTRVSEQPVRDLRLLCVLFGSVIVAVSAAVQRMRGARAVQRMASIWVAIYALVAYGLWLRTFSILRYASELETLSGVVIVSALAWLSVAPLARLAVSSAAALLILSTTVVPVWERRAHAVTVISAEIPTLPADSTVLIFGEVEKAFLAPMQAPSVRWIGLQNSLISVDRQIGLQTRIAELVADAHGPLWSITDLPAPRPAELRWFERLHLRQTDDCSAVPASIAPTVTLCRLERVRL